MQINKAILLFSILVIVTAVQTWAQNTLPQISVTTEKGYNIISWQNPYKSGVKAVIVERSNDSSLNFSTIGMVKDINNSIQSFVDATPLAGTSWYRVNVVFESGIDWKSDLGSVQVDSADIINRKTISSNDTLQKKVNEAINKSGKVESNIVTQNVKQIEIPKSKYIFTNPFSGNINIELPNTKEYNYNIIFFTQGNKKIFDIPRIHEDEIILDKRNFQNIGTYLFIVYRDDKEFEKGSITIY